MKTTDEMTPAPSKARAGRSSTPADSEMNREGTCPVQLQCCDEEAILTCDLAAHRWVVAKARHGSEWHIAALQYLRREAKPELAIVLWGELGAGNDFPACLRATDHDLDQLELRYSSERY